MMQSWLVNRNNEEWDGGVKGCSDLELVLIILWATNWQKLFWLEGKQEAGGEKLPGSQGGDGGWLCW